jgi:1-deoxy-D-xylulose-5-phosphate synthase
MITIEEGSIGGFGSHVKNLLAEKGIFDKGLKFRAMTLPDTFIEQDNPKKMYDVAGLKCFTNFKENFRCLVYKRLY